MYFDKDEVLFEKNGEKEWYMYIPSRGLFAKISSIQKEQLMADWKTSGIPKYIKNFDYINIQEITEKEINVIPSLSINISEGCQLRCSYCYLSATSIENKQLMTFEEGKVIFDAYIKYLYAFHNDAITAGHTIWISFFGGAEPTYNWIVFEDLVNYIKDFAQQNNINLKLRITTNGYYDKQISEFISNNFNKVLLSFDGNEIAQNTHRKTSDGSDSFGKVYNSAKVFYSSHCSFSIRMTVSSETINYLHDSLEFLGAEFSGTTVLIGKVSKIGRAEEHNIDYIKDFDSELTSLLDKFKNQLSFAMIKKKKIEDVHTCYCGAVQGKHFIISKNGVIKTCAHFDILNEFVIGKIIDGEIMLDKDKIIDLQKKYNVCNRETCKECIAKYYCAGGCPSNEKYSYEDYKSNCKIQKKIFISKLEEAIQTRKRV